MAKEEKRRNPFATALERAAQVPVNAAKLPFTLLREAINPAEQRRLEAPEAAQRALYEQATGQPAPFSEGRQWANRLSLGLIPDNQPTTVDPSQLDPQQAQRFGQMTPLMQSLLQSKRPQDFADLMNNEALFAEPAPNLKTVGGSERLYDVDADEILVDAAPPDSKVVTPGSALVGPDGEPRYTNEWVDPSLAGQRDAAADASRATADLRRAEAGAVPSKIEMNEAKAAEAQAKADAEGQDVGPTLGDRNKISVMEARVNSGVAKRVDDLDRGSTAARNATQLFDLREADKLPVEMRRELEAMGFRDLGNRAPRAVQDLMLLQVAVRATDPPGRISDTEQKLYSAARELFDPGIVEAIRKGQTFTNAQRNEVMYAIKKQTTAALQTNDQAVVDGRKTALRDLIAGNGKGMNPSNIQDRGVDLRQAYFGQELGDQAAYPEADQEAEQLLDQLWDIKNPGKDPSSASDVVRFANEHGFRVREFEQ